MLEGRFNEKIKVSDQYLPTYDEAYDEGLKRGYEHAQTNPDSLEVVADSPGWVSGNLQAPYASGWRAGVMQFLKDEDNV